LRDANLPELHLFNSRRSTFRADTPHLSIERKVDMRAHRIFLSIAIAMGCSISLQNAAFSQEYRGTWEQQRACTPDVWRLCGAQIPDVDRIVACLRRNTPQLSDRCARFLNKETMRPHVVRIATTGKSVTIEIMGRGITAGTTVQGVTTGNTGQGLTTMTTNKGKIDCTCAA
jgi:hypothetical protein